MGLQWYDFHARQYDPQLGRFHGVDPMAGARSWVSPYNFVQNNPVNRIDPTGALDDDYKLNKDGELSLMKKTEDSFDRIYNSDETESVKVEKGFISGKTTGESSLYKDNDGNPYRSTYYFSEDVGNTKGVFEFFARNTNVEFGIDVYSKSSNKTDAAVISTSHEKGTNPAQAELIYRALGRNTSLTLVESTHSHPGAFDSKTNWPAYPSGFNNNGTIDRTYSGGDRGFRNWLESNHAGRIPPHLQIYIPSNNSYIKFNSNKYW